LVLSTLHAGDAIESIERLRQLLPEEQSFDCLKLVVAQRLVPSLREDNLSNTDFEAKLTTDELKAIGFDLDGDVFKGVENFSVFRERTGSGFSETYKGLTPIHEVLQVDQILLKATDPREYARQNLGYIPLQQDGLIKAITGYTTLEAVVSFRSTQSVFQPKEENNSGRVFGLRPRSGS